MTLLSDIKEELIMDGFMNNASGVFRWAAIVHIFAPCLVLIVYLLCTCILFGSV